MNEVITSKENKNIKHIRKLLNLNNSIKEKLFISFDLDVIKKSYKLGLLKEVYISSESYFNFNNTFHISNELMNQLNKNKSNIIGVISYLLDINITEDKIIYLDEIRDPINLSKIIYLMKQYHYKRLILSKKTVSIYNQKVLEEIKDLLFYINISYGDISLINSLKIKGYHLYSTGLRNAIYLNKNINISKPYILVFGNEANGVNKEIIDISDKVIKIPIENMESLNVAVAASIILNQFKI